MVDVRNKFIWSVPITVTKKEELEMSERIIEVREYKSSPQPTIKIRIDSSLQSLIPVMNSEDYQRLKKDIAQNGLLEPIEIWKVDSENAVILDGHHRFKVIEELEREGIRIEPHFREVPVKDRLEAIAYVFSKNVARRQMTDYQLLKSAYNWCRQFGIKEGKRGRPSLKANTSGDAFASRNLVPTLMSLTRKGRRTVERFLFIMHHLNGGFTKTLIQLETGRIGIETAYNQLKGKIRDKGSVSQFPVTETKRSIVLLNEEAFQQLKEVKRELEREGIEIEAFLVKVRRGYGKLEKYLREKQNLSKYFPRGGK